jgi:transcriptional regulator with XRE-family HTH domain
VSANVPEEEFFRALGRALRHHRLSRGLTQAELAERARVEPNTISRAENGRLPLSLRTLRSIGAILRVDPGVLVAGLREGDEPPPAPDVSDEVLALWASLSPARQRALALAMLTDLLT